MNTETEEKKKCEAIFERKRKKRQKATKNAKRRARRSKRQKKKRREFNLLFYLQKPHRGVGTFRRSSFHTVFLHSCPLLPFLFLPFPRLFFFDWFSLRPQPVGASLVPLPRKSSHVSGESPLYGTACCLEFCAELPAWPFYARPESIRINPE